MPLSELHRQVVTVALRAAARHGFALGGGNALIAYGIIARPTQDVDLVTNRETGVAAAAGPVEAALRQAGLTAQRADRTTELAGIFPGLGDELADWAITAPSGRQTDLQLAFFDRSRDPVTMDIGPVLNLEDVAGSKVCALAGRAYSRDYVDTAALLGRWTPAELIGFARRLDPGLDPRDLAGTARRLDQMPDTVFAPYRLTPHDITVMRQRFTTWPRTAAEAARHQAAVHQAAAGPEAETTEPETGL